MDTEMMTEQLFPMLITGDRAAARSVVNTWLDEGMTPESLTQEAYWPLLEMINTLYRNDQLTNLAHHYATRLLRNLVDQSQARYTMQERTGKRVMLFCGATEADDLAAQIVADLIDSKTHIHRRARGCGRARGCELVSCQEARAHTRLHHVASAVRADRIGV